MADRESLQSTRPYGVDSRKDGVKAGGAPAYTMGLRNKWRADDHRRGPGSYNPSVGSGPSAPSFSMGARPKPKANSDSWQRGPGSYDLGEMKRGPSFSLGARDSFNKAAAIRSSGPGPGSYNVEQSAFTKASAPAYSIAGRGPPNPTTHSPGPGAYNLQTTGNHRSIASSRPSDGAGLGRSTMRSAPAFSFGTRPAAHVERTPGPGAYNTEVSRSGGGPAYSITGWRGGRATANLAAGSAEKDLHPGPGAYDVIPSRTGPAFTMAHKRHGTST